MKSHFGGLILGIILFGFGCGYFGFEILDYDFKDNIPKGVIDFEEKEFRKEIDITKVYNISNYDGRVNIIIDEDLGKEIVIKTNYAYKYLILNQHENIIDNKNINIIFDYDKQLNNRNIKELYNLFKSNVKNKEFYDYSDIYYPIVNVYVNSTYFNLINKSELVEENNVNINVNF